MIRPPLPVTVVTGFLGAGKTTLLSNLLNESKRRRLAIVVNEFGEVSIDGALLREHERGDEIQVQDVANGLLAYGEDEQFMPLMAQIHARRDLIDHVVIETSGLAVPTAVMERLQTEASLAERFVLDATLAVVDTPLLLAGQFDINEADPNSASIASLFRMQIENADVVVLNKIDALDKAALLRAESAIRELAPGVRFVELAYHARLDTRLALGLRLHQPGEGRHSHSPAYTQVASLQASPAVSRRLDGHSHSGLAAHTHGLLTHKHFHEHDPGWQSFVLHSHSPQDEHVLIDALAQTAQTEPVMRIKGFVRTAGDERPILIQGVRARIVATRANAGDELEDDPRADDHDEEDHHEHHHAHGHAHTHVDARGDEYTHTHDHDHVHAHEHSHDHDDGHEHGHGHDHDVDHDHDHDHAHDDHTAHAHHHEHADAHESPESQLVFIGYHATRKRVADLLTRLTGTPWH